MNVIEVPGSEGRSVLVETTLYRVVLREDELEPGQPGLGIMVKDREGIVKAFAVAGPGGVGWTCDEEELADLERSCLDL